MMDLFFPYKAKLNQVLGILRVLYNRGGKIKISELSHASKMDLAALMPQIVAARMVGAIRLSDGDILLTDIGRGWFKGERNSIYMASNKLKDFEPFRSALKVVKKQGHFSVDDLEQELNSSGIMLHSNPLESKILLRELLIQWAIYFDLFDYNGIKSRWKNIAN